MHEYKFLSETRRSYRFKWPRGKHLKDSNIRVEGDVVIFSKDLFKSAKSAEEFIKSQSDTIQEKNLVSSEIKTLDVEKEFSKFEKFFTKDHDLKAGDFVVFSGWVANNMIDRDTERFSLPVLKSFAKTAVGRPIIKSHDVREFGDAKIYNARIETVTFEEGMKMLGHVPFRGYADLSKTIAQKDKGIHFLVVDYYMLKSDTDKVKRIQAGLIKDMSVGFRAPVLTPMNGNAESSKDENDILYWEYQNSKERESEISEISHVYTGAQYGAVTKNFNIKKDFKTESKKMEVKLTALSISKEIDPEENFEKSVKEFANEIDEAVLKIQKDQDTVKISNDELKNKIKAIESVFGEDYDLETLKEIKKRADEYKKNLVDECIKYSGLLGIVKKEDAENKKALYNTLPVTVIQGMVNDFKTLHKKQNPPASQTEENNADKNAAEDNDLPKAKTITRHDHRYQNEV